MITHTPCDLCGVELFVLHTRKRIFAYEKPHGMDTYEKEENPVVGAFFFFFVEIFRAKSCVRQKILNGKVFRLIYFDMNIEFNFARAVFLGENAFRRQIKILNRECELAFGGMLYGKYYSHSKFVGRNVRNRKEQFSLKPKSFPPRICVINIIRYSVGGKCNYCKLNGICVKFFRH